ncbi:hypothetical protein NGA_0373100 [Nannochloropsis gaditana CCMP526]|uniref:uncharacterized protein n=1 Tax=Nannochloropsis gaditana (strain CCMP526) TaxID=1093141 RepID=UPI00029F52E9|nr:hypothetical protein NGA_0373100 [Nannochloropsis gaditana CCMP526]EKU21309.1 hypothetical protein NGA_0373100 [Nannochloropsis gaditana CCMP526]|eukprot:XP_005855048.1 hypothetical protein NGA_0373100 [Nannochloropsis gaditana CCMP526]
MASRSFPSISFQRIMAFVKARPGIVAGGALLAAYFLDPDERSEDDVDELPLPSFHNKLLQNQNRSNRHILPPSNLIHSVTAGCLSAKKSLDTHPTGTEGTLVTNAAHFESLYQLGPKLGTGAFAVVYKCTPKSTSSNVAAVKVFDLSRVPAKKQARIRADIHKEYTILQSLQHDRIVQVYDLFEAPTQNKVYVVMEFCQGGELFERIVAKTTYNEKEARDVIRTLLTALAFCHEDAGVVHRDLKPENLLLESETDDLHIKVADFGAACLITESDCLSHYCGTPSYTAPEILARQKYGPKVDVWSAGIIAYILLGGYPPFADNQDQLRKVNGQAFLAQRLGF